MNTLAMVDFTFRTLIIPLYSLYGRKYKLTVQQLRNPDTKDYDEAPVAFVESDIDGHEYVCAHFRDMTTRKFFDLSNAMGAYRMRVIDHVSVE